MKPRKNPVKPKNLVKPKAAKPSLSYTIFSGGGLNWSLFEGTVPHSAHALSWRDFLRRDDSGKFLWPLEMDTLNNTLHQRFKETYGEILKKTSWLS